MSIELLVAITCAVLLIVLANSLASRVKVAGPLLLVTMGIGISLLPFVPPIQAGPSLILIGVLPPLLYSAAVSAPAIEFRRDAGAIGGLAFVLVVASSLILGLLFLLLIPGIGFPLAVALGAIVSPTDAVATSIVRKLGAPRRIVAVLEGESLLNDASALVLLRTAVAAIAASFSFVSTIGAFAWSVFCAVLIGALVGTLALWLRTCITSPTANTAIGLTVPYLAFVPTDAVGGSGLVAVVIAGVVCGQGAIRALTPEQRIADKATWRTIEFVLEGAVFLLMGLELWGLVRANSETDGGLAYPLLVAGAALLVLIVVRAAYVFPVLGFQERNRRRAAPVRRLAAPPVGDRRAHRMRRRGVDDAYFASTPLTWRHKTVIVWAGMRGAVTLAAAQTLPNGSSHRDLLVLIAFAVAAGSLLVQGLTLSAVVRAVGLAGTGATGPPYPEIRRIDDELRRTAQHAVENGTAGEPGIGADALAAASVPQLLPSTPRPGGLSDLLEADLALVRLMRNRLHELGHSGRYSTAALRYVMDELDATEISIKLHLESEK